MRDDMSDAADGSRAVAEALGWAVVVLVIVASATMRDRMFRVAALRAVLVIAALGEMAAFVANGFRPRRFAERNGRPYDPAYHGVMQDFGFYNLGFAAVLAAAAIDPTRATTAVAIVVTSYTLHATAHLGRWRRRYYGGGVAVATRPQMLELRDSLQLLAAAVGMALFRWW